MYYPCIIEYLNFKVQRVDIFYDETVPGTLLDRKEKRLNERRRDGMKKVDNPRMDLIEEIDVPMKLVTRTWRADD